jgi:small subunit ribosomal protein S17
MNESSNVTEAKVRRRLKGVVVSDKMTKTVTVLVERTVKHPTIGKILRKTKKYHAHVESQNIIAGDLVLIEECRPISKTKSWVVVELLSRPDEV